MINSDDFYGRDAFEVAAKFLKESNNNGYATIGYKVANTMTENGSVKRGVLSFEDGLLTKITESSIERQGDKIIATPLSGEPAFEISSDTLVSMNMLAFDPSIFKYLEEKMNVFFKENE